MSSAVKNTSTLTLFAGVAIGLLLALTPGLLRPVRGDDASDLRATVVRFTAALGRADAAAVRAETTDPLWARISARMVGKSAGALGTFEVIGAAPVLPALGKAYLSCRQPDGVEDVVVVSLRKTATGWKVCGGPVGCTKGDPFE